MTSTSRPDGSYFAVVTTGAYGAPPRLCDSASRWETARHRHRHPHLDGVHRRRQPHRGRRRPARPSTSVATSVGPTTPRRADRKGTGAVDRQGIAALDPVSGTALSWNPGRDRGLAVWRIVPTEQGLYILNDSLNFGGEYHPRLTYLLTTGGARPVRATRSPCRPTSAYTGTTVAGGTPTPGQLSQRALRRHHLRRRGDLGRHLQLDRRDRRDQRQRRELPPHHEPALRDQHRRRHDVGLDGLVDRRPARRPSPRPPTPTASSTTRSTTTPGSTRSASACENGLVSSARSGR